MGSSQSRKKSSVNSGPPRFDSMQDAFEHYNYTPQGTHGDLLFFQYVNSQKAPQNKGCCGKQKKP